MPGPNSAPNGDTTIVRGHVNEKFACRVHAEKRLDLCYAEQGKWRMNKHGDFVFSPCKVQSLRDYLAERNRLTTGKTV